MVREFVRKPEGKTPLLASSNAKNIAQVNVIGYDYHGYGVSQRDGKKATITHETVFDDILSLWRHVQHKYKLQSHKVVLYEKGSYE